MSVAVVGGGRMGIGIAYVFAVGGFETTVVEPRVEQAQALNSQILDALDVGVRRGKITERDARLAHGRITVINGVEDLPAGLDLVIESVPERFELKMEVLRAVERVSPKVVATNTSTMSVTELARGLRSPEAFLGLHFFNPVWSIGLVEVVKGSQTSVDAMESALRFVAAIGKESVVIHDAPGFATSRLDTIYATEAIRMVEEGVSSAEEIDRAVTLAYRHPVGPLKLSDIVGLDVRLDAMRQLERSLGDRFAPPKILIDLVGEGHLGQKTGRGFYVW